MKIRRSLILFAFAAAALQGAETCPTPRDVSPGTTLAGVGQARAGRLSPYRSVPGATNNVAIPGLIIRVFSQ